MKQKKNSNYDDQIKTGSHTNIILLSPERWKKRIRNENHRRKVSSLMLRNPQKKLDNPKDEDEAKDNEGGDIFLLLNNNLKVMIKKIIRTFQRK